MRDVVSVVCVLNYYACTIWTIEYREACARATSSARLGWVSQLSGARSRFNQIRDQHETNTRYMIHRNANCQNSSNPSIYYYYQYSVNQQHRPGKDRMIE